MYKTKDVILTGFALFAMLFGAGNLIFPPILGNELGSNWGIATFAFILTGVGMPLLGIISSALSGNKFEDFADKVSPLFSKLFNIALIIAIGPLLALPRTGAVAYEVTFYHAGFSSNLFQFIYLGIFFLLALYFSLKSNEVVDKIGKILTPILLVMLAIMLIRGLMIDADIQTIDYALPFKKGFTEGYQTMDTLATILFARIILKSIRGNHSLSKKQEFSFLVKSSIVATIGLAVVYAGLAYMGAGMGNVVLASGAESTDLLTKIVIKSLGKYGFVVLGICVAGACLTTAVGLIVSTAEYFSTITKLSYVKLVLITTAIAFAFASLGVSAIIKIAVPILVFIYPIAMALIMLNLLRIKNHLIFKGSVLFTAFVSIYETFGALGIQVPSALTKIYDILPLSHFGLAWVLPAIIGGLVFMPFGAKKSCSKTTA